jgi:hypothetical protein
MAVKEQIGIERDGFENAHSAGYDAAVSRVWAGARDSLVFEQRPELLGKSRQAPVVIPAKAGIQCSPGPRLSPG